MVAAEVPDWQTEADHAWAATSRDFTDFLLTSSRAERTARSYGFAVRMFWRWCFEHETDPREADRPAIRRWLALRQHEVTAGRVYSDLAALIAFYGFLIDQRLREENPTEGVSIKRPEVLPTEPFTREELGRLFTACDNERDRMIIRILAQTGLRISELASLRGDENVDWQLGRFKFISKGGDEDYVAMPPELFGRLRAWLGLLPYGHMFRSVRSRRPMSAHQIYKRLCFIGDRVDIDVHPHRFRSTFACEYIEQFHDLAALKHQMRHRNIQTTQRYQQTTEARRAAEQMTRFDLGLDRDL